MSARIGPLIRTARHLRPAQALAQLRHAIAPGRRSVRIDVPQSLSALSPGVAFLPPGRHAGCHDTNAEIVIDLLNRRVGFRERVDWSYTREGALWAYHLHQFDHLRSADCSPALRSALIADWIDRHRDGIGWDPHPISHRILSWGKLLLTPGALAPASPADAAELRGSLASQIETLSRRLEVRLQANHLFTNLLAVVFGGLLFEGRHADNWLRASDALRAELRDQVHPDGAHEERSPMYHALLLEQVLDLLNLARASSRAPGSLVDDLRDTASRMCGALDLWTHPDGEIALFSDAALGVAAKPADLADYATALSVPVLAPEQPDRLPYGGYVRLVDESFHLIASVAGPAPAHQPGHAHCDALAFELSVGGERMVTDTGVFEYLPGPRRERARATRSHATLEIDGTEQAEVWAPHRVGGRPTVRMLDFAPGLACEASCEGWATPGVVHRRRFELEGGTLCIHDRLEGGPRPVRMSLPLAPGLAPRFVGGDPSTPQKLVVRRPSGPPVEIELPGDGVRWKLETPDYYPEFGRAEARYCLVGESDRFESGVWRFRLLGPDDASGG